MNWKILRPRRRLRGHQRLHQRAGRGVGEKCAHACCGRAGAIELWEIREELEIRSGFEGAGEVGRGFYTEVM